MKTMKKPTYIKALKIGITALVGLGLVASTIITGVSNKNLKQDNAELVKNMASVDAKLSTLTTDYSKIISDLKAEDEAQINDILAEHNMKLEEMEEEALLQEAVIEDYKLLLDEIVTEAETTFEGFSEDELSLTFDGDIEIDNGDFEKLGDYEIEFDDEDIDVVETLKLSGAFASNDKDFDGETMYKLSEGDLVYEVSFSEDMTALDFDEDTVEFKFLGEDMEVTEWKTDSVKFEMNDEFTVVEGNTELGVTLVRVGENAVLLSYDGETVSVKEDDTYNFGDLEVKVESIFYLESSDDNIAVLKISEDLDSVVEDGDEYEPNDNYEWTITTDSIGLKLVEDFDEDDSAMKEGDAFVLPNDFASVSFELSTENMNKIEVEYESNTEVNFKGDFEDAEGDVVFNGTMFIDEDDEAFASVELKDSDYTLSFNGAKFVVGDIKFPLDVSSLKVNGDDVTSSDVDVKSKDGILVSAPESDLEDGELTFEVPEEAIEATILIK